MEKIVGDYSTEVKMTWDEAKSICKLGQSEKCCAFLACGSNGFGCIRMSFPDNMHIFTRLEEGTIRGKSRGGGKGCAWEEELGPERQENHEPISGNIN